MPRTAFLEADEPHPRVVKAARKLINTVESAGATMTIKTDQSEVTIGKAVTPDGISTINGSDPLGKFFTPPELDFGEEDYLPAGNVETIAEWLIGRMPEFSHLMDARISYFWKAKGGKKGGKVTLGKAQKSSGFTAWVTETDFLMFLSADHCRDMSITNYQMEALIYHELCHMVQEEKLDKDGEGTGEFVFAIAEHDVTAFHNEIQRYGGWLPELRQNRNTWEQVALKETSGAIGTGVSDVLDTDAGTAEPGPESE